MAYQCLKAACYAIGKYSVTSLRYQDIFLVKQWRNDQIRVLRQNKVLSDGDQKNYYANVVEPSFRIKQPSIILFSYLYDKECIGYGGFTNIDWYSRRAEVSFLLNTARVSDPVQYEADFGTFLALLKQVAFGDLEWNRLYTETFDIRLHHTSILERNNFRYEGRMKQHAVVDERFVDSLIHGCLKEYYDAER